ncbi:glutamate racemase [Lacinutrix jangbogonensis]|uniref:glutamate racemase n=1 Tax=Lacinutrix jangbogonensis TaxID=1469557 RepID=UPI00053D8652|nr:glutamate racemase [Lacinutrix jangbogonensis]
MSIQPIGIFDSGVGGTSIWKEIHALLPYENSIYLADSINAPYGPKGKDKIIALSIKNTEFLLEKNCKLIAVACNTASTNAITLLRKKYSVPFIGIEPAIKPAALNTKTKAIGILATKGTLTSALFHNTSNLYSNGITIIEQIGEGIVQLIESGKLGSTEMETLLKSYLKPMLEANIDYLVLGCTHYPYLIPMLTKLLPKHVKIIDSGLAVAKQTQSVLEQHQLLNIETVKPRNAFYINLKTTEVMQSLLGQKSEVDYLEF